MANALVSNNGNALTDKGDGNALLLGSGMVRGAANMGQLRKLWQDQRINGDTSLQWEPWLAQQGYNAQGLRAR